MRCISTSQTLLECLWRGALRTGARVCVWSGGQCLSHTNLKSLIFRPLVSPPPPFSLPSSSRRSLSMASSVPRPQAMRAPPLPDSKTLLKFVWWQLAFFFLHCCEFRLFYSFISVDGRWSRAGDGVAHALSPPSCLRNPESCYNTFDDRGH